MLSFPISGSLPELTEKPPGAMMITHERAVLAEKQRIEGDSAKNKPDGLFLARQFVPERHKLL